MKRLLSLLVVIAMMVSLIPNVFAAKEEIDMDELLGRLVVLEDISGFTATLAEGSDGMIYQWTPAEDETAESVALYWTAPEGTVINVTATTGETTVAGENGELTLPIVAGQLVEIEISEATGLAAEFNVSGMLAYPLGSETNPISLAGPVDEITIEKASWFQLYFVGDVEIAGEGAFNVICNGETTAAVDGKATIAVAASRREPAVFQIDAAGAYTITQIVPVGSMGNPAELVIGENVADIKAGAQGYFFTWIATEEGTLKITMPAGNWTYQLNNLTSYAYGDTQWSDSDPVVNPAEIAVAAGDEIQLVVNTYDPANMWESPAGQLTIKAELVLPEPPAPALTITKQPTSIVANDKEAVALTVEAEGEGLKYQWYRQEPGATTWTAFTSAASKINNFTFTAYDYNNGRAYKCIITDAEGNQVETEVVTLTVRMITKQPTSQYGAPGEKVNFTVGYSVTEGVTYQWQMKYDTEGEDRWRNTSASGNKTNTLTFSTTNMANRYMFRCVITDKSSGETITTTTNVVSLWIVADPATVTSAPAGTLNCVEGYYVFLSVEAEGQGLGYVWQTSTDGGKTYYNCTSSTSAKTANFRVIAYNYRQGYMYRCAITTPNASSQNVVYTDWVTLNVLPGVDIVEAPQNAEVAVGETATFSVKVQMPDCEIMPNATYQKGDGSVITYQWQRSKTGSSWSNIKGATTETLEVTATEALNGYYYRCIATNDSNQGTGYVASAPAQLIIAD